MSGNRYRPRPRRVVYSDSVGGGVSVLVGVGLLIAAIFGIIWGVGKLKDHAEGPTAEQKAAGAPNKAAPRRPVQASTVPPPSRPTSTPARGMSTSPASATRPSRRCGRSTTRR